MSIIRGTHRHHSAHRGTTSFRRALRLSLRVGLVAGILLFLAMPLRSSTKLIDLDRDPNHTTESPISYTVTQISTTKVHVTDSVNSRVLNGTAYAFNWPTAGPGGFSSAVSAPLAGDLDGVSVQWTWETDQSIVSQFCSTDPNSPTHCIQLTAQPSGTPTLFAAQLGAKISSASVSPTSESLTSSLITIFSPPHELVRVTSDVRPLTSGEFQYRTQVQNLSGAPIVFDLAPGPLGCSLCGPGQTDCDGACVDTGNDQNNCGACGTACAADEFCSEGSCQPICSQPGTTLCGESCVNLASDENNCGACGSRCFIPGVLPVRACCSGTCTVVTGNDLDCGGCGIVCPEGFSCQGSPTSTCQCPAGFLNCSGSCVDPSSDPLNCGACGHACSVPSETCQGSKCVGTGALCGNGVRDPGEECDGQDLGGQTCTSIGFCGGTLSCDSSCSRVISNCVPCTVTNCGNGVIDPGEQCDGQNLGEQFCSTFGFCGGSLSCSGTCSVVTAACGPTCAVGETCVGGVCQPPIGIGLTPGSGLNATTQSAAQSTTVAAVAAVVPQQTETSACEFVPQTGGDIILLAKTGISLSRPGSRSIPIGNGETVTVACQVSRHPAKEVTSQLTVCGANIPAGTAQCSSGDFGSQGSVNVLIPDDSLDIGDAFVSPLGVDVRDSSGDGVVQPGESFDLFVTLTNAGPQSLTGITANLSAPASALGPVQITRGSARYPDMQGTTATGGPQDCSNATPLQPVRSFTNSTPFTVVVPPGHTGDSAQPFHLQLSGQVAGAAASLGTNFVVGIGSVCTGDDLISGGFDHLQGLLPPLVRLVPEGDMVSMPDKPFKRGSTLPLRLRLACGETVLTGRNAAAPRIAALEREGTPVSLDGLDLDAGGANKNGVLFRFDAGQGQWIFNLKTGDLSAGRYVITIQMPNGRSYSAGLVLK